MNYTQAVMLARSGQNIGFEFLYEQTYRSKYYLALQYMKNEEAAKDVLQEAYLKAFSKLNMLENPEAFPGWLGCIVANTAKNMLIKKNPLLFSDISADDGNESFEYHIEDGNMDNQPELHYTRQETQQLVHELIDALSEEQRLCILMYHIEGVSIREIAQTLGCSENTVKSRLKYGRNNLKIKAEQLRKKGYRLYTVAPLPLFIYLIHSEQSILSADGTLAMAGNQIAQSLFGGGIRNNSVISGSVRGAVGKGTGMVSKAAGHGLIQSAAIKAAAITVVCCITGGAIVYGTVETLSENHREESAVVWEQSDDYSETEPETETMPVETQGESETETIEQTEEKESDGWRNAYVTVLEQASDRTYEDQGLVMNNPGFSYCLHDFNDDSVPELVVIGTGTNEEEGGISFRQSWIGIYSWDGSNGAQLDGEFWYYMPGIAREDTSDRLIIYCVDPFNGNADYYAISMDDGVVTEEKIYNGQFSSLDYYKTFNEQHGFISLEIYDRNDLSGLLNN